ncbi:MAG: AMIN domain-containing protein, partial [Gemmatimonadota bacterium]
MIPIMALRAVLLTALAGVQGLSVVSADDHTNVIIEVNGDVTFEHQMLGDPPRIVVDVSASDFELPRQRFMDIDRGGVLALRSSQYQAGVIRIVVDLAESVDYTIDESDGAIRIAFPNPAGAFEPWSSGNVSATPGPSPTETRPADRAGVEVPVSQVDVAEAQEPEQPPITVEFRTTPIADVLNTFADFSGRSIVPGGGVDQQSITAAIRDQPWDEAMRAILEGQGLTATELPSGIIMVTSLGERRRLEEQEETVTEAFQLQYVSA